MFDAQLYGAQYTILTLVAALFWIINQALLFMAAGCYAIKQAIIDVTAPDPQHAGFVLQVLDRMLRDQSTSSIQQLVYLSLSLAVLLLFGAMLVRPILAANPVDPKRAMMWLFAASMLFTLGSGFFLSLEQLRESLREMAQTTVLQSGLAASNPDPSTIHTNLPNQMGDQRHYFNNFIPCQDPTHPCNGLDLALSYLFITQETEVTQMNGGDPLHQYMPRHFCERNDAGANDPNVPLQQGYAGYFYWDQAQGDLSDNTRRQQAVNDAVQSVLRMLTALPISLFALLEAVIYLVFTLSAAILFFSVPIALVFAFFQSTEVIVVGVMRAYMTLFVKTYAAAAVLTLIFTFLLFWAQSGNAGAFLMVTLVMLVFAWQFVGMAWQTLQGSFSMVTEQLNRAVGTRSTPLSTAPIPTVGEDGRIRMQGGFAGLRAARGALALARGPMGSGGGGEGRPLVGLVPPRDEGGGLAEAALGAAALGTGVGAALAVAGAVVGGGRARRGDEDAPPRRPPTRPAARQRDGAGLRGEEPPADMAADGPAKPRNGRTAGRAVAGAPTDGDLQPAGGRWWRNEERGQETGRAAAHAAQAPDPAAGQAALERTVLSAPDQAQVAAAVRTDPATAQAILRAADATFKSQTTAGLAYLDAEGHLALGSPGMRALLDELDDDLPPPAVQRLAEEPAGQEQLRTLVGARGGFERQWTEEELLDQISGAAQTPGASLATLTARMGVPGSAFGGASPTVDHLIRELHELDLTDPAIVRDLVQGARQMQQANPETTFSAAARQRFAAEQGLESSVSWNFIRLQEAAAERARARGEDPARGEQAVSRLMRDSLAVPPHLFTPTLPTLPPAAGDPAPPPGAGRATGVGRVLDPVSPPSGNGVARGDGAPRGSTGEGRNGRGLRPPGTGRAAGGGAPPRRAAVGEGTVPLRATDEASGPPLGGRHTTPLTADAVPAWVPPVGAVVPVDAVAAGSRGAPAGAAPAAGRDPASGAHEDERGAALTAVGDGDADVLDLLDLTLAPITDPDPTSVWDAAEIRRMAAAIRAAQAAAPAAEGDPTPAVVDRAAAGPPVLAPMPEAAGPPRPRRSGRGTRASARPGGSIGAAVTTAAAAPPPPPSAPAEADATLPDPLLAFQLGYAGTPADQLAAVQAAPVRDPGVRELLMTHLVDPATAPPVRAAIADALEPVAPALQEGLADLPPAPDPATQALVDQLRTASQGPAPAHS